MTENERNLRIAIEQQMTDINRLLDKTINEIQTAHGLAIQARTRIERPLWHPFPAEKPPTYGDYLTTREYPNKRRVVGILTWSGAHFTYWDRDGLPTYNEDFVTAWMSLPLPYEKGETEPCTCANCKHLEMEGLGEAVCGQAHKGMVSPHDSCNWFERRAK